MLKPKEQALANIQAIKALRLMEKGQYNPQLVEAIKQFNGWGSIWQVFRHNAQGWAKQCQAELKTLISAQEFNAAQASILNAHYTDPKIVKAVWNVLQHLGVQSGRAIEPACGCGLFMRHAPSTIDWTAVELDPIPASITQFLHPNATVYNQGFETVVFPDNLFDLAISNVPFGSYKLNEPRYNKLGVYIHSHFIAKMTDLVRPGGLIVAITSTGTMDTDQNQLFREWMAERTNLLMALRLPNDTFKEIARTEVTTDLLIFQKTGSPENATWTESIVTPESHKVLQGSKINRYYFLNKHHLLGQLTVSKLYGGQTIGLKSTGINVSEAIVSYGKQLQPCYHCNGGDSLHNIIPPRFQGLRPHEFCEKDGFIYQRVGAVLERVISNNDQIRDLIELALILENLIFIQGTANEAYLKAEQESLNRKYDEVVRKYGHINGSRNQDVFGEDPRYPGLAALETPKMQKADIFTKRTTKQYSVPDTFDDPEEALIHCLNVKGRVDPDWIAAHMKPTGSAASITVNSQFSEAEPCQKTEKRQIWP